MSKAQRKKPGGGGSNTVPQPTGLIASLTPENKVFLQWNPVAGATTYWICRDTYVPAIITSTRYTDESVSPNTSYVFSIRAVVNSVLGPHSAPVTIKTN